MRAHQQVQEVIIGSVLMFEPGTDLKVEIFTVSLALRSQNPPVLLRLRVCLFSSCLSLFIFLSSLLLSLRFSFTLARLTLLFFSLRWGRGRILTGAGPGAESDRTLARAYVWQPHTVSLSRQNIVSRRKGQSGWRLNG